jgi:hypothetical protein
VIMRACCWEFEKTVIQHHRIFFKKQGYYFVGHNTSDGWIFVNESNISECLERVAFNMKLAINNYITLGTLTCQRCLTFSTLRPGIFKIVKEYGNDLFEDGRLL